jgi:hypothetical protein
VEVSGGTIVGRDQHVAGDLIQGDKYEGCVNVSTVFAPVRQAMATAEMPPARKMEALQTVRDLETEAAKGEQADDGRLAQLVDGLVDLVPGAVSTVVNVFASPLLVGVAGPVTSFVLDKLKRGGS